MLLHCVMLKSKPSIHLRKQAGRGLPGFILCFGLVGLTSIVGSRLIPVYIDHFRIKASLHELSQDGGILHQETGEILDFLQQNWSQNKVTTVASDSVHIERLQNKLKIDVRYDVVKPILGNVDAVIHFDDAVIITGK